jgi:hypothetical protein
MSYTNADGLYIKTHADQGTLAESGSTLTSVKNQLVIEINDATEIPSSAATPTPMEAFLPAGCYITNAFLIVETAFTSGGSATLTIGTYTQAGAAIDADGIDAAVALSALNTAGKVVANDGAQVGGAVTVGSADAYVKLNYGTAAFTAGAGKLVIEYAKV